MSGMTVELVGHDESLASGMTVGTVGHDEGGGRPRARTESLLA